MANVFAANGFQQYQGTGVTPSYEQTQLAISGSPLNTTPIFYGDPVVQATGSTGLGTGYITQAYGPVTLTVSATGIATTATGSTTITFTAATTSTSGNLPSSWAPPVGSTIIVTGATAVPNGAFVVISSTATTAVCTLSYSVAAATSSTSTPVVTCFVPVAGIFVGCRYYSVAQKKPVWSNFWPGSDANSDIQAYVITDSSAQFSVCTGNSNTTSTAVGFANIGQNIGFSYTLSGASPATVNGNTSNGLSTFFADQYSLPANSNAGQASNSFLPFRIISLQNYVPGQVSPLVSINGNDNTTAYNRIIVGFNTSMGRGFAGI